MTIERRHFDRISRPFEGSWNGSSGATPCRIADISLGGCFVQSLANPSPGESTTVTVTIGDHRLSFPGSVVYSEPGMGFAVRFKDVPEEELAELGRLLTALNEATPGA